MQNLLRDGESGSVTYYFFQFNYKRKCEMEVIDEGRISWKKGIGWVGRSELIAPT